MGKLSIGQHGITVETHEKTNVMSPYHTMAIILLPLSSLLILAGSEDWIKILGASSFILLLLVWIVIYCTHSIKKPELLQSESYRLEQHKIEAGMLENTKENNIEGQLMTNTSLLINESKEADIND